MNINIREYKSEDLEGVSVILEEAFNTKKEDCNYKDVYQFVACCENEIVGYFVLTKIFDPVKNFFYFLVNYVCVKNSFRNMGIGRKMMDYAYDFAKSNHGKYLKLTSAPFRVYAHRLYGNCGFQKLDTNVFKKEIL